MADLAQGWAHELFRGAIGGGEGLLEPWAQGRGWQDQPSAERRGPGRPCTARCPGPVPGWEGVSGPGHRPLAGQLSFMPPHLPEAGAQQRVTDAGHVGRTRVDAVVPPAGCLRSSGDAGQHRPVRPLHRAGVAGGVLSSLPPSAEGAPGVPRTVDDRGSELPEPPGPLLLMGQLRLSQATSSQLLPLAPPVIRGAQRGLQEWGGARGAARLARHLGAEVTAGRRGLVRREALASGWENPQVSCLDP